MSTHAKPRRTPVRLGPGDAEIWTWLDRFASCVRTRDFAAARALFVRDTLGFGTVAGRVTTIDQLIARQWKRVWPNISRFRFLRVGARVTVSADGLLAVVQTRWTARNDGVRPTARARKGRATLMLCRNRTDRSWRAAHSHFSLNPPPLR